MSQVPIHKINLTDHLDRFVGDQLSDGRFQDVSEVMRAGLRLLEQQTIEEREKLALLRTLAQEGFDQLDQGQGLMVEGPRQVAKLIAELGRNAATLVKRRASGA